ncbi:S-adenosyl-L-methionine-dependent methyltransferase [Thermoascus aurantiacus ATCC 26904]
MSEEAPEAPPGPAHESVGNQAADIEPSSTDETDSNYYSDTDSDLTSLASEVTNYVYENGRRYHSYRKGKYVLPNDEEEKDRLDLVHHVFTLVLGGKYHVAPLNHPQTILDLGTGTGIWALDMADLYPSAKVIGNDLSPIQPQFVAPNTQFVIEDFEEEWVYDENYFDYIHGRTLAGSVRDWPELFAKAYKHLKPGGYLEMQEAPIWCWSDDDSLKPDSPLIQFLTILEQESSKAGRSLNIVDKLKPWMIDAGFRDVQVQVYKCPWGPWPKDPHLKEIGRYQYINAIESVDAYGLALLTRSVGYTEEQAKIFLAIVKNQLRSKSLHAYNLIYFVTGRKPTEEELRGSSSSS